MSYEFTDPGATANDACDGSVPVTVSGTVNPNVVGTYTLSYTATDGTNSSTVTRTVKIVSTIAPTITINGANPATVECHTSYTDAGATATDWCRQQRSGHVVGNGQRECARHLHDYLLGNGWFRIPRRQHGRSMSLTRSHRSLLSMDQIR